MEVQNKQIDGSNILFVGHSLKDRGGIATLENSYKSIFYPYKHVSIFREGFKLLKYWYMLMGNLQIIGRLIFDSSLFFVHIHTASGIDFYRNCIPIYLAKLFNKKVVLHIHGGFFPDFVAKNPKKIKPLVNKTDSIIVVSEYLKSAMLKLDLKPKVQVIYNILEKPAENSCTHKNIDDKIILGVLGKICENKGIYDLIDCFVQHPELKDKYQINVAGIGEIEKLNLLVDKYNLKGTVSYKGWVSGASKINFFSEIDILVQVSHFESFGLSVAEAMSYGIPAIVTNVGGLPEVVENNQTGLLVEPGNQERLFAVLSNIQADNLTCLGINAKNSVSKFYKENIIIKLSNYYKSL